jgi:hypothetical protein
LSSLCVVSTFLGLCCNAGAHRIENYNYSRELLGVSTWTPFCVTILAVLSVKRRCLLSTLAYSVMAVPNAV